MIVPLFAPVATVLTVYGIETGETSIIQKHYLKVATVLTVYGIETLLLTLSLATLSSSRCNSAYRLRY